MSTDRYKRQIQLPEFGPAAQKKLQNSRILVVGLGGLGIPALQYLNAMGAGTLGMVEQDLVEKTNLHRQVLYSEADVGQPKIKVAYEKLRAQNPDTQLITHDTFLVKDNALNIISQYDLVIDASDNFATRYLVNDACVILKKPFIYGALHGFEGQLSIFNYNEGPTYRCLFPSIPTASEIPDCNQNGVLGVLPAIIGSLQALEAIKIVCGIGEPLVGKLLLYNGLQNSIYKVTIPVKKENKDINELEEHYRPAACDDVMGITAEELERLLAANSPVQLVDVRSREEFADNHLPGSVNIPMSDLAGQMELLSADQPLYLICQSGIRSLEALYWLRKQDYPGQLINLTGGLNAIKSGVS